MLHFELISSDNHIAGGVSVFVCVRLLRVLWYCGKIWAFLGRVLALQTNYHDSDSEREERGVCVGGTACVRILSVE